LAISFFGQAKIFGHIVELVKAEQPFVFYIHTHKFARFDKIRLARIYQNNQNTALFKFNRIVRHLGNAFPARKAPGCVKRKNNPFAIPLLDNSLQLVLAQHSIVITLAIFCNQSEPGNLSALQLLCEGKPLG